MGKRLAKPSGCATEFVLAIVNGKWKTEILRELKHQPCRYSQLRGAIPGLSDKMLSQRLHDLIDSGLVTHSRLSKSLIGHYSLTPNGRVLERLLQQIGTWGEQHSREFHVKLGTLSKFVDSRRKAR